MVSAQMPLPASDRFDLVVSRPAAVGRWLRALASLILGVLSQGGGNPVNPGGRRLMIVDRRSGRRLVTICEPFGAPLETSTFAVVEREHRQLDADLFERRWVNSGE
jgi:hypothetical protein